MKTNKMVFQKIPVYNLIELLVKIYEDGADYVDISGKHSIDEDSLLLFVRDEYMSSTKDEDGKKLTDEDLNQLI